MKEKFIKRRISKEILKEIKELSETDVIWNALEEPGLMFKGPLSKIPELGKRFDWSFETTIDDLKIRVVYDGEAKFCYPPTTDEEYNEGYRVPKEAYCNL